MKEFRIDNKGSGKIFENRLLETLTKTHFLVPVILYYFLALLCIYYAISYTDLSLWHLFYAFPIGWILFTLVEYLIHRYIFHFNPTNKKEESIQYSIHGVHHEFPKDKNRLVMPPLMSIVLAIGFYGVFWLIAGEYVWLYFPGFLSGYSSYLIIHYAVHRFRTPNNFLKIFWKHHSLHHYSSVESAFSVSFPLWDYIFGTMPRIKGNNEAVNKLPDHPF